MAYQDSYNRLSNKYLAKTEPDTAFGRLQKKYLSEQAPAVSVGGNELAPPATPRIGQTGLQPSVTTAEMAKQEIIGTLMKPLEVLGRPAARGEPAPFGQRALQGIGETGGKVVAGMVQGAINDPALRATAEAANTIILSRIPMPGDVVTAVGETAVKGLSGDTLALLTNIPKRAFDKVVRGKYLTLEEAAGVDELPTWAKWIGEAARLGLDFTSPKVALESTRIPAGLRNLALKSPQIYEDTAKAFQKAQEIIAKPMVGEGANLERGNILTIKSGVNKGKLDIPELYVGEKKAFDAYVTKFKKEPTAKELREFINYDMDSPVSMKQATSIKATSTQSLDDYQKSMDEANAYIQELKSKKTTPPEVKKVSNNLLKNNPGITQRDAEAMARDIIDNRKFNKTTPPKPLSPAIKQVEPLAIVKKERYSETRGETGVFHDVYRVRNPKTGANIGGVDFTSESAAQEIANKINAQAHGKGVKPPAIKQVEPLVEEARKVNAVRYSQKGLENTDNFRGGTWYSDTKYTENNFQKDYDVVGGEIKTEAKLNFNKPLIVKDAYLEDGSFSIINNNLENVLPAIEKNKATKFWDITNKFTDGEISEAEFYNKSHSLLDDFIGSDKLDEMLGTTNQKDAIMDYIVSKGLQKKGYDGLILQQGKDEWYFKFNQSKAHGKVKAPAIKQVEPLVEEARSPFKYQDTYIEGITKTELRGDTSATLEASGDIFRELSKDTQDFGYVTEKITSIKRYINGADISRNQQVVNKLKRLWENAPTNTAEQRLAKDINIAILNGDKVKALSLVDELKNLKPTSDFKLELTQATGKVKPPPTIAPKATGIRYPKDINDRIIAGQDLSSTAKERGYRIGVNPDGSVDMWHGTTSTNAEQIIKSGKLETQQFLSPNKKGSEYYANSKGKGGNSIKIKVDARDIEYSTGTGEVFAPDGLVRDVDGIWKSPNRMSKLPTTPEIGTLRQAETIETPKTTIPATERKYNPTSEYFQGKGISKESADYAAMKASEIPEMRSPTVKEVTEGKYGNERTWTGDITIYRVVPKGEKINVADFVFTNKKDAELFREDFGFSRGQQEIVAKTINGKDLINPKLANSPNEAIYFPEQGIGKIPPKKPPAPPIGPEGGISPLDDFYKSLESGNMAEAEAKLAKLPKSGKGWMDTETAQRYFDDAKAIAENKELPVTVTPIAPRKQPIPLSGEKSTGQINISNLGLSQEEADAFLSKVGGQKKGDVQKLSAVQAWVDSLSYDDAIAISKSSRKIINPEEVEVLDKLVRTDMSEADRLAKFVNHPVLGNKARARIDTLNNRMNEAWDKIAQTEQFFGRGLGVFRLQMKNSFNVDYWSYLARKQAGRDLSSGVLTRIKELTTAKDGDELAYLLNNLKNGMSDESAISNTLKETLRDLDAERKRILYPTDQTTGGADDFKALKQAIVEDKGIPGQDKRDILSRIRISEDILAKQINIQIKNMLEQEARTRKPAYYTSKGAGIAKRPLTAAEQKSIFNAVTKKDTEALHDIMQSLAPHTKWDTIANIIGIPRSIMSSFDLSAPLRQGIVFAGRPEFWKAFSPMLKSAFSQKEYDILMGGIRTRDTYKLMRSVKLGLTDISSYNPLFHEEAFISNFAEKIPGFGRIIKGSNRAYTAFLNKLRADVFDTLYTQAIEEGLIKGNILAHTAKPDKIIQDIARFVNNATGRGNLGALNSSSVALNSVFFSPRLMASRLNMGFNPYFYHQLDPFVRRQAVKDMAKFAGIGLMTMGLAKLAGAKIETDPRSSDFGQIRVGNTRYDMWGGFRPYVVLMARLAPQLIGGGATKSATTGRVRKLGDGFNAPTRWGLIGRFITGKESPAASFAHALLNGKDWKGKPIKYPPEVINRFIPMVIQDIYDLYQEEGAKGIFMGAPGVFGVGSQTFGKKERNDIGQDIWRGIKGGRKPINPDDPFGDIIDKMIEENMSKVK